MRVRWLCGGRVFDGVLREAGVEYDLEDATARSLIASGFVEAATTSGPVPPVRSRWSGKPDTEQED